MPTLGELGKQLLGTLNDIVTGGDAKVPPTISNKVSWCQPGIPFMPEDFTFAAAGLGSASDAERQKLLYQQAFNFSTAVDFVPDVTGVYNGDQQQMLYRTSQARMSHIYGEILRFSKVVQTDLSEEEKAKLEKFRKLLYTTKKDKNLVTGEEKEVTVPGPVLEAYNTAMGAALDARMEYNNKRIAALSASGPQGTLAVNDWAINAENYYAKVKAADARWVSQGYKNEVEQMNAYIGQVTQRSMALWKQQLLELYDRATLTDPSSGLPFKYTTLIPGNFANAPGWTKFSFNTESVKASSNWSTSSWSGGGGIGFGLYQATASASSQSSKYSSNYSIASFRMSFELAQVVITPTWFYPEFLMNRGWMLRKGEGWMYDQYPSDGANPPKGNLIGYPTTALFARNIVIDSKDFASAYEQHSKSIKAGGSAGYGPFLISGSYSKASGGTDYSYRRSGTAIEVPGMQIIAFLVHLVGKAPNPLPDIPPEAFQ
jgi:hypothetical protein